MWCARHWVEAREAGMAALAMDDSKTYRRHRQEEYEWFGALLVVNRVILGIRAWDPRRDAGLGLADANPEG
jgi:hypothetical protein